MFTEDELRLVIGLAETFFGVVDQSLIQEGRLENIDNALSSRNTMGSLPPSKLRWK